MTRTSFALAALALTLAGCGDVAPDALDGTCGTLPAGLRWSSQPGCIPVCLATDASTPLRVCRDSSSNHTPYCVDVQNTVTHCGDCDHNCTNTECRPQGGVLYRSACRGGVCICTQ